MGSLLLSDATQSVLLISGTNDQTGVVSLNTKFLTRTSCQITINTSVVEDVGVDVTPVAWAQVFAYYDRVAHTHKFRYSTSHWRGGCGAYGDPSKKAPGSLNTQVEDYVEALRDPLRTRCRNGGGSTYNSDTNKVDGWFCQRQGSGRVITLSNINQQVSQYIKNGYPVVNNFWYNKNSKSGHSVVVTKIKEKSREYNSCRQVGWWWGKKTVCELKTQYEYEWYRRMGWGGSQNAWYPPAAYGAFVAVV